MEGSRDAQSSELPGYRAADGGHRPTHGHRFPNDERDVRYTPDACFVGTDVFGYQDVIQPAEFVITVTVVGPAVGCTPTATESGQVLGTEATRGPNLAATGAPIRPAPWLGIAAIVLGLLLTIGGRRRSRRGRYT